MNEQKWIFIQMIQCKFCKYNRKNDDAFIGVDFYLCEECESVMCIQCMYTSMRGRDYCTYCKDNLQYEGKLI